MFNHPIYKNVVFLVLLLQICNNTICRGNSLNNRDVIHFISGKDVLSQITQEDCIYEISDIIDLNNSNVVLPNNVILLFKGGMLINGSLVGTNTNIDAGNYKIFENINLFGTWRNDCFYPEWFGAFGDGKQDDTKAFRLTIRNAFNNHKEVKLSSPYYYVSGNNPLGLEYFYNEDDIVFSYKEKLKGDDNRSRYNLNINGNGSLIYWKPLKEDDVFAFVGYLRYSIIQNINIYCMQQQNQYYGDIFSTTFYKKNQSHIFSNNTFRNIRVSGGCRRVFSFDCNSNENQSHDDLSVFEQITATNYKVFCYISNGNAVGNAFYNCNTSLCVDGAVDYYIDCPSWAGNLRIIGQHFTIRNCTGAILLKDDSSIIRDRIVYIDKPRLEVLNTAKKWKYFDISGITLYINGIESITNPGYDKENEYGVIRTRYAQANISDVKGLFQPFALYKTERESFRPVVVYDNCSFRTGDVFTMVQEYPLINYHGKQKIYKNTAEAILSTENFPYYRVKHSTISENRGDLPSWNKEYEMGRLNIAQNSITYLSTPFKLNSCLYSLAGNKNKYYIPFDMIITSFSYIIDDDSNIQDVYLATSNKYIKLKKELSNVMHKKKYSVEESLAVKAGSSIQIITLDHNGKERREYDLGVRESYLEIVHRPPYLISDYKLLLELYK